MPLRLKREDADIRGAFQCKGRITRLSGLWTAEAPIAQVSQSTIGTLRYAKRLLNMVETLGLRLGSARGWEFMFEVDVWGFRIEGM